jgi:dTDP-4-dehydrorhamnose 3,5-epimerase
MPLKVVSEHLNGIVVLQPEVFYDERGFFMETFRKDQFEKLGLPTDFQQHNHSRSVRGVVRGLHFQWQPALSKLMRVTIGTAFLVAADIRKGSPTLGQWYGIEASAENKLQLFAPASFARGFCVLSEEAEIQYICTGTYNKATESGIKWNDPKIGVEWPMKNPILSKKDEEAQSLDEWLMRPESDIFKY